MPPRRSTRSKSVAEIDYRALGLVDLIRRIVAQSDREALAELHAHRSVFQVSGRSLLLVDFLARLRSYGERARWAGSEAIALDRAYDLTLEKFRNLPAPRSQEDDPGTEPGTKRERPGPDCRCYFGAFLERADGAVASASAASEGERESGAARLLQNLVRHHFRLSCLEHYRRSTRQVRRHTWKVAGQCIHVWMPSHMSLKQCDAWLQSNLQDLDLSHESNRKRIADIVGERLVLSRLVSLTMPDGRDRSIPAPEPFPPDSVEHGSGVTRLAEMVTKEKLQHPELLGPTIHALGQERLGLLIRRIFDDVLHGVYCDAEVRTAFGVEKSTFSRFAGSEWSKRPQLTPRSGLPDLWANVAQMVYTQPAFADAVDATRIRERIEAVLLARRPHGRRKNRHE